MRLMETRLIEIIRQERSNDKSIHLYGTGGYWVAFEESAYLLCQVFSAEVLSVISHASYPFPIVMASISDQELAAYSRRHIVKRNEPEYKELVATAISFEEYRRWHAREVREFM